MAVRNFQANVARGTPPFSYAWEGQLISNSEWEPIGADEPTVSADDDVYDNLRVVVTNSAGSASAELDIAPEVGAGTFFVEEFIEDGPYSMTGSDWDAFDAPGDYSGVDTESPHSVLPLSGTD